MADRLEPVAWYLPADGEDDSMFRDASTVKACTGNPWTGWIPLHTAAQLAAEMEKARAEERERCAKLCDAKFAARERGGFPREASTARALAKEIRQASEPAAPVEGG